MVKKALSQEQKANAVDAEIIGDVPVDATPKQVTLNESIEQINKSFEAIQANSKTFMLLVESDLKIIGGNIQLLINAVNGLSEEVERLKNPVQEKAE